MGIQQQFTSSGDVWTPALTHQQSLQQGPIEPPISMDGIGNSLPQDPGMDMMSSMMQAMMSMQQPQVPTYDIGSQVSQAVQAGIGARGTLGTQAFQQIQKGSYY